MKYLCFKIAICLLHFISIAHIVLEVKRVVFLGGAGGHAMGGKGHQGANGGLVTHCVFIWMLVTWICLHQDI